MRDPILYSITKDQRIIDQLLPFIYFIGLLEPGVHLILLWLMRYVQPEMPNSHSLQPFVLCGELLYSYWLFPWYKMEMGLIGI